MTYPMPNISTNLTGQTALVTGASSGLGLRFARVLAAAGAKVALAARNQPDKYLALHFALMSETVPVNAQILMQDAQKAGLNLVKLKADMERPEIAAAIDASHDLAKRAGIDGTPTFIVNGAMHPGAVDDVTLAGLAAKES